MKTKIIQRAGKEITVITPKRNVCGFSLDVHNMNHSNGSDPRPTFVVSFSDSDGRDYSFHTGDYKKAYYLQEKLEDFGGLPMDTYSIFLGEYGVCVFNCRTPYGSAAWEIDGMEVTLMDDEERHHHGL